MNARKMPRLAMALNNAWAKATHYNSVQTLPPDAFTAARPGPFFSLSQTLNHINAVDLYYLDFLESGDLGRSVFDGPDIDDPSLLGQKQYEADLRFTTLCGKIADNLVA